MLSEVGRYLRWWISDHRWDRAIFIAPLTLALGPYLIVWSIGASNFEALAPASVILLVGLFMLCGPLLSYMGGPKPWQRPRKGPETAPVPDLDTEDRASDRVGDRIYWGAFVVVLVLSF